MNLFYWYLIGLAVLIAGIYFALNRKPSRDIPVTIPEAPQLPGRFFGFYGVGGDQVNEVRGFTNLLWLTTWRGIEQAINDARSAQQTTVLDVDMCLWDKHGGGGLFLDAEQRLRNMLRQFDDAGVLHLVKAIVPKDEPNLPGDPAMALMPEAVALIRRVIAEFPALQGCMLGCMYAGNKGMPSLELFDLVGFDDYDARAGIFAPGAEYSRMKARLLPHQRTFIVPGGFSNFKQDPKQFLDFMNNNPEVLAIVAFLWTDPVNGEEFHGIRSIPEMRAAYESVGRQIVAAA